MGRQVFTAGEILTAASMNDLGDQTVMVFDDATARATAIPTPVEGMVTYLKDTDAVEKFDGSAFGAFGGKVLQSVSATDSTVRSTTSGSFTSATITASITPASATSNLLISWNFSGTVLTTGDIKDIEAFFAINNGTSDVVIRSVRQQGATTGPNQASRVACHLSAFVSHSNAAVTFTGRFRVSTSSTTVQVNNNLGAALLTILEVEA